MDDYNPKLPRGGRRRWPKRIVGVAIKAFAIICLLVTLLIVFSFLTHQIPFVEWSKLP